MLSIKDEKCVLRDLLDWWKIIISFKSTCSRPVLQIDFLEKMLSSILKIRCQTGKERVHETKEQCVQRPSGMTAWVGESRLYKF